jgi:non-haem Fe2+, alpha-ketoglutarate-dependent halogenase
MGKLLTAEEIASFERTGFHFPVRAIGTEEARFARGCLEAYERQTGGPISSNRRHKVHLLFKWVNDLVRNERIVDAIEDVLGPDILCWNTNFFIKEANDPGFVSWHQDSTYWGLEPADVVTAWVAQSRTFTWRTWVGM